MQNWIPPAQPCFETLQSPEAMLLARSYNTQDSFVSVRIRCRFKYYVISLRRVRAVFMEDLS